MENVTEPSLLNEVSTFPAALLLAVSTRLTLGGGPCSGACRTLTRPTIDCEVLGRNLGG